MNPQTSGLLKWLGFTQLRLLVDAIAARVEAPDGALRGVQRHTFLSPRDVKTAWADDFRGQWDVRPTSTLLLCFSAYHHLRDYHLHILSSANYYLTVIIFIIIILLSSASYSLHLTIIQTKAKAANYFTSRLML